MVLVESNGRKVQVGPKGMEPIADTHEGRRDLQAVAMYIPGLVELETLAAVEAVESQYVERRAVPAAEQQALGDMLLSHS
jgi:hypothetical protein